MDKKNNKLSLQPRSKKSTVPQALIVILLMIAVVLIYRAAAYPVIFGFLFGYILQRSRFCFAAGFRDVFMIRNTTLARAVLVALALTTLGLSFVSLFKGLDYLEVAGRLYPLGLHTITGGLLFGFGMVIAGACVSGCLVRMGEGYIMQLYTFAGLLTGSLLGAWHYGWWKEAFIDKSPTIFLPNVFGWFLTVLIQLAFIVFLYLLSVKYETGSWPVFKVPRFSGDKNRNLYSIIKEFLHGKSWPYIVGAIFIALNGTLLFYFWGRPWAISAGITHFAAWILEFIGPDFSRLAYFVEESEIECIACFWQHPLIYMVLGIILGSLAATLMNNEFRWRRPRSVKYVFSGLAGGFLMGYSARVAMGCNIGGFLGGVASLSLHGWLFGLFILIGAYFGGKFLMRYLI